MDLKYDYNRYSNPLKEDMETVEKVYTTYLKEPTKLNFWKLEEAVYDISLTIKSYKVCGQVSETEANEMKEYYWRLLQ